MSFNSSIKLLLLFLFCFYYAQSACVNRNGIVQVGEECDTGFFINLGCINCVVTNGYSCTNILNQRSTCNRISCGDNQVHTSTYCDHLVRDNQVCALSASAS